MRESEPSNNKSPARLPTQLAAWVPSLAVAAGIFALSSLPGQHVPGVWLPNADKLAHCFVYAMLGAALAFGIHRRRILQRPDWLVLAVLVIGTLYGISDELHQLYTPNRSCEFFDVLADAVGSLIGGGLYARFFVRRS